MANSPHYMTSKQVAVLGAAGAIGSNLAQSLLNTRTAHRLCLYDPFAAGVEGVAEELYHCAFPDSQIHFTTDLEEALDGSSYIISSGGAPRTKEMTREDLLRGNSAIARELGQTIKRTAPNCQLCIVIFNPADITGLGTLVFSGLEPSRVVTLAGLDSARLQRALSRHFKLPQDDIHGCRTYGGHGESMAIFSHHIRIADISLDDIYNKTKEGPHGTQMSHEAWEKIQHETVQGGANIIRLRGRSSFQSPAQHSVDILRSAISGTNSYPWPCGSYINTSPYNHIMMALETKLNREGVHGTLPEGSTNDLQRLDASYRHLCTLRDTVIGLGNLPPISEWKKENPALA